jgi:uncharacterized protein DUF3592
LCRNFTIITSEFASRPPSIDGVSEFLPPPTPRRPRYKLVASAVGMVVFAVAVTIWLANREAVDERALSVTGVVDSVDPDAPGKYEKTLYHYTVDGRTYHGTSSDTDTSKVGKEIPVRYDPRDPSDSWIDHHTDDPPASRGPGGLTVFIVAVVLVVLVWFMARPPWRRAYRRARDAARR